MKIKTEWVAIYLIGVIINSTFNIFEWGGLSKLCLIVYLLFNMNDD